MPGTRRTPISRQRTPQVTPTAVKIFEAMRRCVCTCDPDDRFDECPGCKRWWDLHHHLSHELGCKPWEFPCIEEPRGRNPEPTSTYNHELWQPDLAAQERWRALEDGAREMRRAERAARRAKAAPPRSPPDQQPPP
jgi:hypothetical protein